MRLTERPQPRPKASLRVTAEPIGEDLERFGRFAVVTSPREGLEVPEQPLRAPRLFPEATAPPPLVGIEPPHALSYEADGEFFPERGSRPRWLTTHVSRERLLGMSEGRAGRGVTRRTWAIALAFGCLAVSSAPAQEATSGRWREVYRLPEPTEGAWLVAMWAGAPNDVWAVGRRATVHFDGSTWTRIPDHSRSGIFAIGRNEAGLFTVGSHQTIQRWSGTEWVLEHQDVSTGLRAGHLSELLLLPGAEVMAGPFLPLARRRDGTWARIESSAYERAAAPIRATPAAPCSRDRRPAHRRDFLRCTDGTVHVLLDGRWQPLGMALPPVRSVDALASGNGVLVAVLSDGSVWSKVGGTWSRELQVSRGAGHGLVFSGDRFYLTDGDRILAR